MTNIVLSALILTSGVIEVRIPPVDPTHIFVVETSTNLSGPWGYMDSQIFVGCECTNYYFLYPTNPPPEEFFRVHDLGEYQ